jgi:phosphoadenosine phosphosulfate reductase
MQTDITVDNALQKASVGLRKKMEYTLQLLQKAEKIALSYDQEDGFYLAFSGGKDSQALLHMAQLAGVKFRAHMNLTSVDPPEVIRFVRTNYKEVELNKPHKSIFRIAVEKQILPTQRVRWCCAEYKENAGAGKVTLIGIRRKESSRRAKRNEVEISNRKFSGSLDDFEEYRQEQKAKRARRRSKKDGVNITNADNEQTLGCINGKESLLISPIINWSERDVWEFLNDVVSVPHCSLYDESWKRIGCIGCPMSSRKQKLFEIKRYPHVKRNWIKAIKAIRAGGGIQKRTYLVEHPQGLGASQKRQRIAQDAGGYIKHPESANSGCGQTATERQNVGLWALATPGFSESSSSDRLTEEQEDEIAENIYDWWISGVSYKKWYAQKFLQLKFNFDEDGETN